MADKPADFFLNVIDFFAVLLPGAILAALLWPIAYDSLVPGLLPAPASDAAKWLAFGVAAHFLGHFLVLLGASLDPFYDAIRRRFRTPDKDTAYAAADAFRKSTLGKYANASNTYQWAKSMLRIEAPTCVDAVDRLEADSKFFRSVSVVLIVVVVILAATAPGQSLIAFVLLALSLWRYGERRYKSNQVAYRDVVALLTTKQNPAARKAASTSN
jgi:hypothetical protein